MVDDAKVERHAERRALASGFALVTFCNAVTSRECSFALVDLATENLRELPFDYLWNDHGATGLARLSNGDFILGLPGSYRYLRLSPTLSLLGSYVDYDLDEIHSVAVRGDSLFAVATSKDAVVEYQILSDGFERIATHRLTEAESDTLHINSVCTHRGRVLISAFGEDWRHHPVGFPIGEIVDLESGESISKSLSHPHSLVSFDDDLYVLGSFFGTIEKVDPKGEHTVCASYPGYLRGLSFFDRGALVGVSGRRDRSRGLGTPNAVKGEFDHRCGILCFTHEWEMGRFIDLSWFGREIFDVMFLEEVPEVPSVLDSLNTAKHRSVQLAESWQALPGELLRPDGPPGTE